MTTKKTTTTRTTRARTAAEKPAAKPKRTAREKAGAKPKEAAPAAEPAAPESAPTTAGKMSALDAAAKVLAEAGTEMNCQELVGAMAEKGYWSSPGGKTPHATLHAAISREIAAKGEKARFVKAGRGRFALNGAV
jgi:HB1, ASXL, restriction endonuclease HTH domain